MYRKFYKLSIIGNLPPTILHIPNRNNGILECWNEGCGDRVIGDIAWMHGCMDAWMYLDHAVMQSCQPAIPPFSQSSKPIIPFFQHSIIPVAERSGAKF